MNKIVYLSFSGGLDSTTLLYDFRKKGFDIRPIFFMYGSKHNPYEFLAATRILERALPGVKLSMVDLYLSNANIFSGDESALLADNDREIPTEPYTAPGSLDATVVPGRNLIMASILASKAEAEARKTGQHIFIAMAVHAGDHALYPDCRPAFMESLNSTIKLSTAYRVELLCPFIHDSKADIVRLGHELGVPFELTRSCYGKHGTACGKCGTCRERLAAFAANGLEDPAPYAKQDS